MTDTDPGTEQPNLVELEQTLTDAVSLSQHPNQAIGAFMVALCHHLEWVAGIFYVVDPGSARMLTATHEVHLREETRTRALQLIAARPPGEDFQGLGGRVLESGKITIISDVQKAPHFRAGEYANLLNLQGAVAVPVYVGDRLGAVVEFFATRPMKLDRSTKDTLERVSEHLGQRLAAIPAEAMDADLGAS